MRHPLAFPDRALEQAFREQYAENGLPTVRLGLALGAFLYALFGVLDAFVAADDRLLLWSIRLHLEDRIAELAALRRRYGGTGCLVLLHLDGFKAINDLFGHWSGDRMLREVARQLVANARATDLVFRYGGDEFCLLLPSSSPTAARAMLERVRAALREQPVGEGAAARVVDLSAGCIAIPDRALQPADLIAQADELLLAAKRLGKGRILLREEKEDDEETETARGL